MHQGTEIHIDRLSFSLWFVSLQSAPSMLTEPRVSTTAGKFYHKALKATFIFKGPVRRDRHQHDMLFSSYTHVFLYPTALHYAWYTLPRYVYIREIPASGLCCEGSVV